MNYVASFLRFLSANVLFIEGGTINFSLTADDFHCKIKTHSVRVFFFPKEIIFIDTHVISGYRYSLYFISPVNRQRDPRLPP